MSEGKRPFPLHAGLAEVVAVTDVTPAMRRVKLRADDFGAELGIEGPGELITLGWADEGHAIALPKRGWAEIVKWWLKTLRAHHWRNFTVRFHDPATSTIDVDFFLHGDAGTAARWALEAAPGQTIGYAGPRSHFSHDPAAEWSLLVADETGLPALLAFVESLPADHPVIAIAEVADADEEQTPASCAADVEWRWLHRGSSDPGTTTLLADQVAALELPAGPGYLWGAAEAKAMRAIRDDVRGRDRPAGEEVGVHLLGYWKRKG